VKNGDRSARPERTASILEDAGGRCLTPRNFALGFAAVLLCLFHRVLLGGESFALGDFSAFGYPLAHFHRTSFWNGELPLWNSLSYTGIPWLAQWNTLCLYPGSLLYLIPPLPWSLNLYCVAHLHLAGVGMYLLTRKWTGDNVAAAFAATAYALGGLTQNCLMWPNNIAALAWLPFVLLTLRTAIQTGGRTLLLAIVVGSLQMLTGAPEIILLTWLGGAFVALIDLHELPIKRARRILRFGLVVIGIAALCAIQLFPFLDLLRLSSRTGESSGRSWVLGPLGWIRMIAPLFETRLKGTGAIFHIGQAWTHSIYLGLPVIWLALHGLISMPPLRRRLCIAVLTSSLLLTTGLANKLLEAVPIANLMRYPVKFILVWMIALPLLAAFGLHRLRSTRRPMLTPLIGMILLACLAAAVLESPKPDSLPIEVVKRNFMWRVLLGAASIALCIVSVRAIGAKGAACQGGAFFLLVCDLFFHQPSLHPSIDAHWYTEPNPVMANFSDPVLRGTHRVHPGRSRQLQNNFNVDASLQESFILTRVSMSMNWNLVEGLAKAVGFYSLWLPTQSDAREALFRDAEDLPAGLADFLAIRNLTTVENSFDWPLRDSALAPVTIGMRPLFGDAGELFEHVRSESFDPRSQIWIPRDHEAALKNLADAKSAVADILIEGGTIRFSCTAQEDCLAAIAVTRHPGWEARVDDVISPVYPANHGYMAIRIPAGQHSVSLVFRDRAFEFGRWVSLVTLIGLIAAWGRLGAQAAPPKVT
jgi:hypothetical protein